MDQVNMTVSVTPLADGGGAESPAPLPLLSAVVLSGTALASSVTLLASAHVFHDATLSGDFVTVRAVLDPTHTDPKVSPPEGSPQLFRIVWRRRNGEGVADTLHVIDSVSALTLVEAQAKAEQVHAELIGDVAAVYEIALPNVLEETKARLEKEAQRERFLKELNRRDAQEAQRLADAAARKQARDDLAAATIELENGIAAVRLERDGAKP